jgi:selenocysteine lyase/cysteine desulfurase
VIDIDVERDFIDLLAFPGHKALYGPPGTGGLYVGERTKLIPWREGGTGFNSESIMHPEALPVLLEGGTPNSVGIVGLREGVEFILEEGIEKIRSHERALVQKLRTELKQIPGVKLHGTDDLARTASPVSFVVDGIEPQEFAIILDQSFEIAVRAGLHCAPLMHELLGTSPRGSIRFSPGYFNTLEEAGRAVSAVREIQAQAAA